MQDLLTVLDRDGQRLGGRDDQYTWAVTLDDQPVVAKVMPCHKSEKPNLPRVSSTPPWLRFQLLSLSEVTRLELDTSSAWVLAIRPRIPGKTLEEAAGISAATAAIHLVRGLRDLHESGVVHGDIQPRNVIVDDDGKFWFIDVQLTPLTPQDVGYVAGSAPLMAPELWAGEPATEASDRYALATLIAWLGGDYPLAATSLSEWAVAHREEHPNLALARQLFDKRVVSILSRMLAPHPDERPPLQELLDALQPTIPETPVVTSIAPHEERIEEVVETLGRRGEHVEVGCANAEDLTNVVHTIARRLEFGGRRVLWLAHHKDEGPWSPVIGLLRELGDDAPFRPDGDQLRVFDELARRLFDAIADLRVTLVFERIEAASPDLVAWWRFLHQRARARAGIDLSLFSTTDEAELDLEPIAEREWLSWRARTLRAEVRGIAQKRWKELVENHGQWLSTMTRELDREFGIESAETQRPRPSWNTAGLAAVGTAFAEETDELMRQCAFGEAAKKCQVLFEAIENKSKVPSGTPDHTAILERWVEAAIRGARGLVEVENLVEALKRHADQGPRIAIAKARLHQSLGDHRETLETLKGSYARFRDSRDEDGRHTFARIQALRGQSMLSTGAYEETEATAKLGFERLGELPDAEVRPHLKLLQHAPAALRGEPEALAALLELTNETRDAPAILLARAHSYRAVGLARRDELDDSTDAYIRALEVVETAGLAGELPTFLLNAGTAYHKQGKLGLAREYYARGTRSAQPTTRASTRALLLANQANIDHALGRHDEARSLLERGLEIAVGHELRTIAANCRSLMADVELAEGSYDVALEIYRELLGDESLTDYQRTEAHLAAAEALLQLDRWPRAQVELDAARRLIEEAGLSDLEHHQAMMRARLQWAQGGNLEKMAGVELFRRSLMSAQSSGNQKLVLRQSPYLVAQLEREGLDDLLDEVSELVQNSRNAIAMGLTRELRRDFFANLPSLGARAPTDSKPEAEPAASPAPRADSAVVDRFYRMLSLNEMILRSESLNELLPTALEIAMSLSSAERGFLLLRDANRSRVGDFVVAASRDVDGATIPAPHLKVSLTIAEEAARTGRTVVTINARDDERFNTALSVVDLDLSSVLCVPVRDASGLLGALYLDHRFRPGIFGGEVPRMMEAFGHQVALAITNARRIDELENERHRLAEANAEVEKLLEERELMMRGLEDRVSELSEEVERQRASSSSLRDQFSDIAFTSETMERLLDQVQRVARGDIPVVVTGESGVGKELIARAIHDSSPRRSGPFVAFNCGAVSESLFESELFGHLKGSFTGATTDRKGLFLSASGGTIFLDEVGEMPLSMQVKLLRVLQEKQVRRVGSTTAESVDVRVVAATHRDLMTMVDEKDFREDLYYRLAAVTLDVPALRERREDIPIIAQTLLSNLSDDTLKLTPTAVRLLTQAEWRGNVRELENVLRAASVLGDHGSTIGEEDLAPLVQMRQLEGERRARISPARTRQGRRPKATRADVVEALRRFGDDRELAAEHLGVSGRTLYRYLRKWDLYPD